MSTIEQRLNEIADGPIWKRQKAADELLSLCRKLLPAFHGPEEKPRDGEAIIATTLNTVDYPYRFIYAGRYSETEHYGNIPPKPEIWSGSGHLEWKESVKAWIYESDFLKLFTTWAGEGGESNL